MKELLLHLFNSSANVSGWYASLKPALDGVTESQARRKPAGADHSIAAITAHLHFYQIKELHKFQGKAAESYSGNNDITFTEPAAGQWEALVTDTFATLAQWQQEIAGAGNEKLAASANLIGEIAAHLAYHTGQIVLIRKWQNSWDPDKGVQ